MNIVNKRLVCCGISNSVDSLIMLYECYRSRFRSSIFTVHKPVLFSVCRCRTLNESSSRNTCDSPVLYRSLIGTMTENRRPENQDKNRRLLRNKQNSFILQVNAFLCFLENIAIYTRFLRFWVNYIVP